MATPPVPKQRTDLPPLEDSAAAEDVAVAADVVVAAEVAVCPVPLPRTKLSVNNEKVSASDILRSIGTISKQIKEDVSIKVSHANEKLEKSIIDGSKFAKGTFEKTLTTSRVVRDSVTKSVIEGTKTAGMRLCRPKKTEVTDVAETQRCMSLPAADVSLFDNIQFHSPMLEQKRYKNEAEGGQGGTEFLSLNLNNQNFDDMSLFSSNSDTNTDTISNFSHDSHDFDRSSLGFGYDSKVTYDTPKPSRANSTASSVSLPDVPERRKKKGKLLEMMRQNSLYENWLPLYTISNNNDLESSAASTASRPSYSTIYEFDPLNAANSTPRFEGMSNELLLLESFLTADTYGTIVATDHHDDNFEDYAETDYYNPPTPPERFDSLLSEEGKQSVAGALEIRESNSNWYVANETEKYPNADEDVKPSDSMITRFSRRLKLDNMLTKPSKALAPKVEIVERPPINNLPAPYYSGTLNRTTGQAMDDLFRNSQSRYCVLSDQKLICYSDPTNGVLKEAHRLDIFYSLQIVLPLSSSTTNNAYHFEIMMSAGSFRAAPRKIVFTCASVSERRNWAQKIAEHLTSGFPPTCTAEFTRLGWCYFKEGVTGEWRGAWLMLIRRVLVYYSTKGDSTVHNVDLRKVRCVTTQDADEQTKVQCPSDGSPNLLLDCPQATLYLRFPHEKVLKGWRYMIKLAAQNNGSYIHHQQLTKEDVPVIVEKCVSFIYAHGSLSEGIYRRAGGSCTLAALLNKFRRDAWSVQLSLGEHSEHDVAGVLKRFLRDLPDTLIPRGQYNSLLGAIVLEDEKRRHAEYRRIMLSLPLVARNTARKLFAHLHFLQTMAHANKMNAENLASVWAPTIMPAAVTSNTVQTAWSAKEVFVVRDLIAHYEAVWEPTEAEKRREAAIRRVLMRVMSNSAPAAPKAAGDLRAWIYVRDRSMCHQVALSPSKTSADVCIELCEKANTESHLLMLEEVICNESMRRIVHNDEIVLDVVLRWGYWDEDDRKENYLVVKENSILHKMDALQHSTSFVCGELKIATEASKTFKLHMFELRNGCLCYFKDKQGSHKIEEWNIKDILWYMGHEPKRNPQSRWAITFIPRNKQKRSKEKPWFGSTIAGAVTEDRLKWMTAMMFAQHHTILPNPRLVIT